MGTSVNLPTPFGPSMTINRPECVSVVMIHLLHRVRRNNGGDFGIRRAVGCGMNQSILWDIKKCKNKDFQVTGVSLIPSLTSKKPYWFTYFLLKNLDLQHMICISYVVNLYKKQNFQP